MFMKIFQQHLVGRSLSSCLNEIFLGTSSVYMALIKGCYGKDQIRKGVFS